MKKRVTATVDGKPAITPPIFVPYFSAMIVPRVIQRPPTINVRINFNAKISIEFVIICTVINVSPAAIQNGLIFNFT